jgi:N6-L-threonylcarbamoyladenine synthase
VGVNHLEAHFYANWLVQESEAANGELPPPPELPVLCLIVSGGHTVLVHVPEHGRYVLLGQTIDDAAGEAFDKVARLLDLGYPGGPAIEKAALDGDPTAFDLPRAWLKGTYDFSFSGLKTAVLRLVQRYGGKDVPRSMREARKTSLPSGIVRELAIADIAASFQEAVVDVLVTKTAMAAEEYEVGEVVIAGGVAANMRLRHAMTNRLDMPVRFPPLRFCTDNAAMVASAGYFESLEGGFDGWDMDVYPSLVLPTSEGSAADLESVT